MTPAEFYKFAGRVRKDAWPCKFGHTGCSDRDGGPCLCEEEIIAFPDEEHDHSDCARCGGYCGEAGYEGCVWDVLSPDGLSIDPEQTYPTREAAAEAAEQFAQRFQWQGYYKTARWERLPVSEIAGRCQIVPVDPADPEEDE